MGPGSEKLWLLPLPPAQLQGHTYARPTQVVSHLGGGRHAEPRWLPAATVSSSELLAFQRQGADLNNRSRSLRGRTGRAGLGSEAWSPGRVGKRREIGGLTMGSNLEGGRWQEWRTLVRLRALTGKGVLAGLGTPLQYNEL